MSDIKSRVPTYLFDELEAKGIQLESYQADALISLCFNAGKNILSSSQSPNFHRIIVSGNYDPTEIRNEFLSYTKQGGQVLPGLVKRREAEANMFNYGIYDSSH